MIKPPATSTTKDGDPDAWKTIAAGLPPFQLSYDEGLKVGYKWYDAEKKPCCSRSASASRTPLTRYSDLKVETGPPARVSFTVKNTGGREGAEVAQVYVSLPASAGEPPKRLVGWSKVELAAGESKQVTVEVPPQYLSIFDEKKNDWQLVPGEYTFMVGGSSQDLPLHQSATHQ